MSANCWRAAAERGPAVKKFDVHFDKEGDTMNVLITGAGRREALGYKTGPVFADYTGKPYPW